MTATMTPSPETAPRPRRRAALIAAGAAVLLLIIAAAAYLAMSLLQIRRATHNNVPGQADEAKTQAVWAGAALGGLVGFGTIIGAIITVAG